LEEAAEFHAYNQGPTGLTGHKSVATSENPAWEWDERIQNFATPTGNYGENISYGSTSALDVMIALMVDDGVEGRGHRKNIMKDAFGVVGIFTGPHGTEEANFTDGYRTMTTLDYAGGVLGEDPLDCPAGNGDVCNDGDDNIDPCD
jgi:uncharacterized protein YkwD